MDYGDDYWGLYRDYCRDPFPHSLLRTREISLEFRAEGSGFRVSTNLPLSRFQGFVAFYRSCFAIWPWTLNSKTRYPEILRHDWSN